jgi:hypothetical protein
MPWTKRQIINEAFSELGLSDYEFDLEPEQLQGALRKLDSMIAVWNNLGVGINYTLPYNQSTSDIDQDSMIPDYANQAVYTNLAISIAPSFGKTPSTETKKSAKQSYEYLLRRFASPSEMQYISTLPAGAGHKNHRYYDDVFIRNKKDNQIAPPISEVEFNA